MTNCTVVQTNETPVKSIEINGKTNPTNGTSTPIPATSIQIKISSNQQSVTSLEQISVNSLSTNDAISVNSKLTSDAQGSTNSISTDTQQFMSSLSSRSKISVMKPISSHSNTQHSVISLTTEDEHSRSSLSTIDEISTAGPFTHSQTTMTSFLSSGQVSVSTSSPKVSAQYLHSVSSTTLSDLFSLMNQHTQDNASDPETDSNSNRHKALDSPTTSSKSTTTKSPPKSSKKSAKYSTSTKADHNETCTENGGSRINLRYSLRSSVLNRMKKGSSTSSSSRGGNENGDHSSLVLEKVKQESQSNVSIEEGLVLIAQAPLVKQEYGTLDVPMTKEEFCSILRSELGAVSVAGEVSCTSESSDCDELTAIYTKKSAPSHFCMSCAKEFGRRSVYLKHICVKCVYCGIRIPDKVDMLRHLVVHETEQGPFVCTTCGKLFTHRKSYQDHQRKHSMDGRFCCSICSKSFKVRSFLTRHELKHMGVRPQSCKFCQKMFVLRWQLREHKERMHGGRTLHKCTLCNQTFSKLDHMRRHLFHHTGEKPFHCLWCNKSFMKKHSLQKHQSQHRDDIAASLRLPSYHQQAMPVSYSAHLSASVKANLRLKKKQEKS